MAQPTQASLRRIVELSGGPLGKSQGAARDTIKRDVVVAQVAYHSVKLLDSSPLSITQEQADYLCSVIASRVAR